MTAPKIEVGTEGATTCWTDRWVARVVEVSPSGNQITVEWGECSHDQAGYEVEGSRTYGGRHQKFSWREKSQRWSSVGSKDGQGYRFYPGARGYYDRSF